MNGLLASYWALYYVIWSLYAILRNYNCKKLFSNIIYLISRNFYAKQGFNHSWYLIRCNILVILFLTTMPGAVDKWSHIDEF